MTTVSINAHLSQAAFGRRQDPFHPGIAFYCHAQSPAKGLEHGFDDVMAIPTAQIVNVQGQEGMIDEALEKLIEEIDIKITYPRAGTLPGTQAPAGRNNRAPPARAPHPTAHRPVHSGGYLACRSGPW